MCNIEDAMYEGYGNMRQARHDFEKLPKEEQEKILAIRREQERKELARSNQRMMRGLRRRSW